MSQGQDTPAALNLSDSAAFMPETESIMSSPYKSVLASNTHFYLIIYRA